MCDEPQTLIIVPFFSELDWDRIRGEPVQREGIAMQRTGRACILSLKKGKTVVNLEGTAGISGRFDRVIITGSCGTIRSEQASLLDVVWYSRVRKWGGEETLEISDPGWEWEGRKPVTGVSCGGDVDNPDLALRIARETGGDVVDWESFDLAKHLLDVGHPRVSIVRVVTDHSGNDVQSEFRRLLPRARARLTEVLRGIM